MKPHGPFGKSGGSIGIGDISRIIQRHIRWGFLVDSSRKDFIVPLNVPSDSLTLMVVFFTVGVLFSMPCIMEAKDLLKKTVSAPGSLSMALISSGGPTSSTAYQLIH